MLQHLRRLTARERSRRTNLQLGALLAFVAGAVNAGGFLAVQRYTSHMTGVVSGIADDLALGSLRLAAAGAAALVAFVAGAAATALLVNWARRRGLPGKYALPLLLEAALLLLFGVTGAGLLHAPALLVPVTVLLLCFLMGLQNAVVTKISHAEVRTTHVTGLVTDLGIELGRWLYWNRDPSLDLRHRVQADRARLRVHALILGAFFVGGLSGALGFKHVGYAVTLPLSALLVGLALPGLLGGGNLSDDSDGDGGDGGNGPA